jgi:hypothetical protein
VTHPEPPSRLEVITGHPVTEAALTFVGAVSGNPLLALLPPLTKSLASERQRQRVESALTSINTVLEKHELLIKDLSDEQYKLINESILALLHTTSPSKIEYLRRAITNGLHATTVLPQEAIVLSRVIRDISAEEADFILRNFEYDRVQISSSAEGYGQTHLQVSPNSPEGLVALGLISLGLLAEAEPNWDDSGMLRFSPITAKLIALLREPDL